MRNVLRPHRPTGVPPVVALPQPTRARSLAAWVAHAYERLGMRSRAHILGRLIGCVGSLALAVIGGGAFARYLLRAQGGELAVSPEDATDLTPAQVYELARYVEQSDPASFAALVEELGRMLQGPSSPLSVPV